jgi:Tol biopolymer transport system component
MTGEGFARGAAVSRIDHARSDGGASTPKCWHFSQYVNQSSREPTMRFVHLILPALLALTTSCATPQQPSGKPASNPSGNRPTANGSEADTLSDIVQLTHGFDRAGEAYFSPDMKWIVFEAVPKGQQHYQMYLVQLTYTGDRITGAQEPIRISPEPSRNTCGFFSPDGKSLIFASTAGKEDPAEPSEGYQRNGRNYRWAFPHGMEIFRSDDWREKAEAAKPGSAIDLATHPITNNDVYDAEGAFSPDGKWIVFCSLRTTDGDVYVMHPDGSHAVQMTNNPGYDGGPFFAPDGKRLVYRSDRNHNDLLQIFVGDLAFDAAGEITGIAKEHQLTNDQNVNWGPWFHPDNHHIIFSTSRHGHTNYELYVMRDDGTHDIRITYTDGADILPVFSNDGKYLMWTSKRAPDGTTQIFLARFTPPKGW